MEWGSESVLAGAVGGMVGPLVQLMLDGWCWRTSNEPNLLSVQLDKDAGAL